MGADEHHQAELELQERIYLALDNCQKAGANEEDLKLLAWSSGVSKWKPQENHHG